MRHRFMNSVAGIALLLIVGACGQDAMRPQLPDPDLSEADSCKVTTSAFPAQPADFSAKIIDLHLEAGWPPGGFYQYTHVLSTTTSIDTIPQAVVRVSRASEVFLRTPDGAITPSTGCAIQAGDSVIVWRAFSYALPSEEDPRPEFYAEHALIVRHSAL